MIKTILHILRSLLIAKFLTILTQVGGVIYLIFKPLGLHFQKKRPGWKGFSLRMLMYFSSYLLISIFIVPSLALKYDRVPLPRFASSKSPLEPARHFYWIANRHYVRTDLYDAIIKISNNNTTEFPDRTILYLDANFPLFDYFPLFPHKSHNDGRRLDIAFYYKNKKDKAINTAPGILGYGHCEEPFPSETDYPSRCQKKGYRLYSALHHITKPFKSSQYLFDEAANRKLLLQIIRHRAIRKVFIEPHLKTRLRLGDQQKIRFHGCGAVRHDDHIHLEI